MNLMKEKIKQGPLPEEPSRRGFIKRAVMGAAAIAALGESALNERETETESVGERPAAEVRIEPEKLREAIAHAQGLVKEEFLRGLPKHYLKGGADHYILAIGKEVIEGKTIGELAYKEAGMAHQGALEYSLVRSGFDLAERFVNTDGISRTLEESIKYRLGNVEIFDHEGYEYEWLTLLTIDFLKRGKQVNLKADSFARQEYSGLKLTLEHMHQKNTAEFNGAFFPERLSEEEKKVKKMGEGTMGMGPTCKGLHALHAMASYEILKKNDAGLAAIVGFIVEQSEKILKNGTSTKDEKSLKERIHVVSHLLAPLSEFPSGYALTAAEKNSLRQAVALLMEDAEALGKKGATGYVPELAHVVDTLLHMPAFI